MKPDRTKEEILIAYGYEDFVGCNPGWSIQYTDGWSAPDPENNITHWQPLPELPIEETKEK